jgi:hypothetical protein
MEPVDDDNNDNCKKCNCKYIITVFVIMNVMITAKISINTTAAATGD